MAVEDVAAFRIVLPSGEPLQLQVVVDGRLDATEAFLADQDPAELERATLNRPDCDSDTASGFVAALLRELADRCGRA